MTTKFLTDGARYCKAVITPVHVERETEQSVWIRGRRSAKVQEFGIYHDTWEAAHAHLIEAAERKVFAARRSLEQANGLLGNVKGMKKPQEAT